MDYKNIESSLKYLAPNGVTLNVQERFNLDLALQTLNLDISFEQLLLWGKVEGKLISLVTVFGQAASLTTTLQWELTS